MVLASGWAVRLLLLLLLGLLLGLLSCGVAVGVAVGVPGVGVGVGRPYKWMRINISRVSGHRGIVEIIECISLTPGPLVKFATPLFHE